MANDVILDLGNEYIGSAYSPVVEITENADGHTISITSADPDAAGHLVTQSFDVPNYADEEGDREAAEATRQAQEAQRIAAEDAREASESARQAAESSRASAETSRAVAESERQGQEQGRRQAEQYRQQNETLRQQDERARQDAEAARYNAEQARAAAETARDAAESERQLAEQAREDAEDARQAAEQARETASATAVANAEAATSAANTATQQAQLATTAANDAAAAATTAAGTANTAAAAADTAREGIQDDLAEMRSDIADKAFVDAYVPLLTAGAALGITGGGPTVDAAFLHRVTGGGQASDGPATIEVVRGNTLRWNQHADVANFVGNLSTLVKSSTTVTVTSTADNKAYFGVCVVPSTLYKVELSHKYIMTADIDLSGITNANFLRASFSFGSLAPTSQSGNSLTESGKLKAYITMPSSGTPASIYLNATFSGGNQDLTGEEFVASNVQIFDLTQMFGAGSEPSTIEEFTALYPLPYYEYDAGSLLSVQMEGIESVGFNQWDEQWELGIYDTNGTPGASDKSIRSKNPISVMPNTTYCVTVPLAKCPQGIIVREYDANMAFIKSEINAGVSSHKTFTTDANCRFIHICTFTSDNITIYGNDFCINISDPARNGEYEPYRGQTRNISATDLRSAGTVYDELRKSERITRVGVVDLGTLTWMAGESSSLGEFLYANVGTYHFAPTNSDITIPITYTAAYITSDNNYLRIVGTGYTDPAAFKTAMNGVYAFIGLATPTVTPIDPPLNMSYRAEQGGTETVLVPTGEMSAPVPMVVVYGSTPDGILDRSASLLAAADGPTATANHGVGDYLTMGGQLYRVTTAIASGETITPGTNVTATTVMAEVIALIAQ